METPSNHLFVLKYHINNSLSKDVKMEIKEIRALTGLSQRKFAEKYHIPIRTIQCWEAVSDVNHRDCPDYVKELLKFKVMYDLKNGI